MDLANTLKLIRERLRIIAVVAVVSGVTAFVVTSVLPASYESHVQLLVGSPRTADYDAILASQLQAQTYAELAKTMPVLESVVSAVGGLTAIELVDRIEIRTPRSTPFIAITARDEDPVRAAAIANAIGTALISLNPGPQDLAGDLTVVDPGVPAEAPSSPRPILNALAAALAGVIFAIFWLWTVEARSRSKGRGRI